MTDGSGRTRMSAGERRRQLVRSAVRAFARDGFHGATTRAIAAEAGVAEALLYRHFSSKRALYLSSVALTADRMVDALRRILDDYEAEPRRAVYALLGFYRTMLLRNPDLAKMIFVVSADLDADDVREVYLPRQAVALDLLEAAFCEWQRRDIVPPDLSPRSLAWLVLGSYQVVALMQHSGRLNEVPPDAARALLEGLLGAPRRVD
jgi:AcrR family transcriptional regulator